MATQKENGETGETAASAPAAPAAPESKIPEWVKAELFEDVLKGIVSGYQKINNFKAILGTGAGENYATVMLRIEIEVGLKDGKSKAISFMLKLPHQLEIFREMMKKTNIFDIERTMYKDVVPELEQMYRDVGLDIVFGAYCYDMQAPDDYVLLEDLAQKGFKNANRLEGLDQAHTECVLTKIAQWHAASAVRVATKGAYPLKLTRGFFKEESKDMMEEINKGLFDSFNKVCPSYAGHEAYFEQIKKLQPCFMDELFRMAKADPSEFHALNHGDLWSNNIMFQYDAFGKIKETYLVDYQIPKYGTVAQDLLYVLLSSTKLEDKISKFDYYVKYYHDKLVEHLQLLKYPKPLPKLRDIHMMLYKYGVWGYATVTGVMAAVLLDPTEAASFENFLSDKSEGVDFKNLMYSNARYRKHIELLLPWLHNRGALEPTNCSA